MVASHSYPQPTTRLDSRPGLSALRYSALGALLALSVAAGRVEAQSPPSPPPAADSVEEAETPHPFFSHMGLPEGVGVVNLRTSGLLRRAEGETEGDFAFHLEAGLTRSIGLHIRNDRFLDIPQTEAMFQFAAIRSKDGMSGFAPIVEFMVPTRSGGGSRITTLVGFTTTLGLSRATLNQEFHYDPRADAVEGSAAVVLRVAERIFPVFELSGEGGTGAPTVFALLGGVKVRLREGIVLGLAGQLPVTSEKEFSFQLVLQPDVEWSLRR